MVNRLRATSTMLVLANLIPLGGVVFFDWDVVMVLALFWLENVFIGLFAITKVAIAEKNLFRPLMFLVHYGGFMMGHGMIILLFYGRSSESAGQSEPIAQQVLHLLHEFNWWAAAALLVSHAWSFVANYIGNAESKRLTGLQAMALPYRRMMITHVALLVGAFALDELGQPVVGVALLVLLKIGLDVRFHISEHRRLATQERP